MRLSGAAAVALLAALAAAACGDARGAAPARDGLRGVIVFAARGAGHDAHVEVHALELGRGKVRALAAASGRDLYPAPGPGGLAIGVDERGPDGHVETLVRLAAPTRPLVPPSAQLREPGISADGAFVVYAAESEHVSDLWRMDLHSGARTQLTSNPEGNFEPALSPDGKWVAFTSSRDGDSEIYVMPATGGDARRITTFHREDLTPSWSPDGEWIAFVSDREGADRLFVVRADGTDLRRLTPGLVTGPTHAPESEAAWAPQGRTLAYVVHDDGGRPSVWLAAVGGTGAAAAQPRRLSPPGVSAEQPAWSPDGEHVVYVERVGTGDEADLVIVGRDGKRVRRATKTAGAEWLPRWLAAAPAP